MRWPRTIGVVALGLLGALFAFEAFGLRINLADSMPRGLYRLTACGEGVGASLRPGDLAAVDPDLAAQSNPGLRFFRERGYLTFTGSARDLLLKEVSGVGGEIVEEVDGALHVDARALNDAASFRSTRARGEVLPQVSFPYRLVRGELWLSSDHPRGIDSRYFGGLTSDAVACRAEDLWTW